MGIRTWLGNTLFNIDKIVDRKVGERMNNIDSKQTNELLVYRQKENAVWAKGNADRILEFYKTNTKPVSYATDRFLFWNWVGGINVPKLHYPAPEALLNSVKSLLFSEDPTIEFVSEDENKHAKVNELNDRLWQVFEDNDIDSIFQNGAVMESYSGGLGFKFNIDTKLTNQPIIELYPQERIELTTKYRRIVEIIFIDKYYKDKKEYTLKSIYGIGYIDFKLYNDKGVEVLLTTLESTRHLERKEFPQKVLMAVYKKNRTESIEFDSAYGGSDFEGIIDLFHQIDEIFSTMSLYIRRSRPILSLNENMIPVSADGKAQIMPKEYEFDIVKLQRNSDAEKIENHIHRDIPELKLNEYINSIRLLQASIYQKVGMDTTSTNLEGVGANQSGEALMQREKSTVILYQNKVKGWKRAIKDLGYLSLIYQDIINHEVNDYEDYELNVGFPDYQSATFQDKVEMFTNAYKGLAVDLETMIKEIWSEDLTEEQMEVMTRNVKLENGIPILPDQLGFEVSIDPERDDAE